MAYGAYNNKSQPNFEGRTAAMTTQNHVLLFKANPKNSKGFLLMIIGLDYVPISGECFKGAIMFIVLFKQLHFFIPIQCTHIAFRKS